jgi:RING finger protein 121
MASSSSSSIKQSPEEIITPSYDEAADRAHARILMFASHLLLIWLFVAQILIVWWKKKKPQQYFFWSLLGLWTLPFALAIFLKNWRFVISCIIFTGQALYLLRLASRRPLDPDTPQFVYRVFLVVHRVTLAIATIGVFSFLITIFILTPFFNLSLPWLITDELLAIFYGGYFGVIERDFASVVSDKMSRAIGTAPLVNTAALAATRENLAATTGRRHSTNSCALCGHELRTLEALEIGKEERKSGSQYERKTMKLSCNHEFHEECIRGWSVVGKKSVCPFCGEKVDTSAILASSPWEKSSQTWSEFLDLLRMSLVWNPLIFISIRIGFWVVETFG